MTPVRDTPVQKRRPDCHAPPRNTTHAVSPRMHSGVIQPNGCNRALIVSCRGVSTSEALRDGGADNHNWASNTRNDAGQACWGAGPRHALSPTFAMQPAFCPLLSSGGEGRGEGKGSLKKLWPPHPV